MRSESFALPAAPCVLRPDSAACHPGRVVLRVACRREPLFARAEDELPGVVGRIADFAGQLYLSAQERPDDWMPVGVNYPVTSGDNLWVSGDGRAEVDYGGGQFRLAGDTNLNVSRLDDRQLTLFVARGRLIVRVRVLDAGDAARIDTPSTQVTLTRPGLYRIDVAADGQGTTVTVREGESLIAVANGAQQALAGQAVTVMGIDPLAADVRSVSGVDGFDTWSANRDRHYERLQATAYVPRQMVGSAELDAYGSWESDATYGPIWYPAAVAPDWAPYSDGYWTNVGEWGLTWVDSAPWGYAPSHYGRWVRVGPRWAWCPGPRTGRPHWAPALVGWYGGAGWGFTANAGAPVYGWVPLGWGDAYHPWWRGCSQRCWSRYNRAWAVNVNERQNGPPARYAHMGVPGAMTAVSGATLVGRKPVRSNLVALPASQVTSAPLLATAPSVASGPGTAPVVRPGERGTPTPASALYSHAKRNPAFAGPVPRPSAPPAVAGGASAGAGMSTTGALPATSPRVRPSPVTAAAPPPTGATVAVPGSAVVHGGPVGQGSTAAQGSTPAQSGSTGQGGAVTRGGTAPAAQSTVAGPREGPPQHRSAPPNAPVPLPASQQAASRPGASAPASAPLAVQQQGAGQPGTFPATGMALPTPSMVAPSSPPAARPVPLPLPLAQPGATVGVAPPLVVAPPVAAPPQSARGKPSGDADAAKSGKAGDAIQPVVPAQR